MPVNFPASPFPGQTYTSTSTWVWDGSYWNAGVVAANLVTTVDTQTLTNKTISGSTNTVSPSDGTVTTAKIADSAVATAKLADSSVTSAKIVDGSIVDADINASAAIAQSKISGLATSLAALAPLASPTFTGTVTLPAATTLSRPVFTSPYEVITVSATAAGTTVQYDADTQGLLYYTANATGNWTLNVRGSSGSTLSSRMSVGQSLTIAFMAIQGATAYYMTALTIDGSAQTVKWSGGVAPSSGNASSVDVYQFTIFKTSTAPAYTVLGATGRYA